jgi:hypothetical protein
LIKLEASSGIFRYTPATSDTIPDFLRLCGVENFIATKICTFINKPFIDGSFPELNGGAGLLDMIRQQLSKHSKDRMDTWTALTVTAMEPHTNKDLLKCRMVREILDELQGITDPRNSQQLETGLLSIVDAALELWIALRSDSCKVEPRFQPELANKAVWFAQETPPFEVAGDNSNGTRSTPPEPAERPPSFALFPQIVLLSDTSSSDSDGNHTLGGPVKQEAGREVVYRGRALFSDSEVFIAGIRDKQELEKLYRKHMSGFSHARKKSLSSPVTDKGFSLRLPEQTPRGVGVDAQIDE